MIPVHPPMRFFYADDPEDNGSDEDAPFDGESTEGVLMTAAGSWKTSIKAQSICNRIFDREIYDRTFDPATRSLLTFRITRAESDRILEISAGDNVDSDDESEDDAQFIGATTQCGRTVKLTPHAASAQRTLKEKGDATKKKARPNGE